MKDILNNGFTIYIGMDKTGDEVLGTALKQLGDGKGFAVEELNKQQLSKLLKAFPSIEKSLKEGNILQLYLKGLYTYEISLGKESKEGPYAETEIFNVVEESLGDDIYTTLLSLEEKTANLDQKIEGNTLKKMYRFYAMDKYVTTADADTVL